MNKTVWLVSVGECDDYVVKGVFTTKEKAEVWRKAELKVATKNIHHPGYPSIKEFELDALEDVEDALDSILSDISMRADAITETIDVDKDDAEDHSLYEARCTAQAILDDVERIRKVLKINK